MDANQIRAKPAASMNTQTSATLAPPSLSDVWPRNKRAATKAIAKALKVSQRGLQPRSAESSELKAIIAPKPTLLNAEPNPGSQTAPSTFMSPTWAPRGAGTVDSGVTSNIVMSGTESSRLRPR